MVMKVIEKLVLIVLKMLRKVCYGDWYNRIMIMRFLGISECDSHNQIDGMCWFNTHIHVFFITRTVRCKMFMYQHTTIFAGKIGSFCLTSYIL